VDNPYLVSEVPWAYIQNYVWGECKCPEAFGRLPAKRHLMLIRLETSSTFFLKKFFLLQETHATGGRRAKKESLIYCNTMSKVATHSGGKICQAKMFGECMGTAMQIFSQWQCMDYIL
jgi:hypothetical protein